MPLPVCQVGVLQLLLYLYPTIWRSFIRHFHLFKSFNFMKKKFCILALSLFSFSLFAGKIPPAKLRCEYEARPLGIDVVKPRLSWQMPLETRNNRQTAYQILVASTEDNLKKDNGDLWNSGRVLGDQSVFVEYKGKPLESRKRYFWKVKIWDEKNSPSPYSETAWWEMGLLQKTDWMASWIGKLGTEGKPPKAVELQREFSLDKRAVRARLYVTGLGAYRVIFNGKKVGNDLLTPGWTHYLKTLHYQTYDVTEAINQGANFLSVTLGSGWWASGLGWGNGQHRYSEGPNRLLFQLELEFYDGSKITVLSDKNWQVRLSPVVENTLYHGETYDARLEYAKEWSKADILDQVSNVPQLFRDEKGNEQKTLQLARAEGDTLFSTQKLILRAAPAPQIRVVEELKPVSLKEARRGRWVFDFGQNIVGFCRLKVEGKTGKEVTLKYAELLDEKGLADQANLRSAKATDKYILKGYGVEQWEPSFTYHGFRYVELVDFPGKPDLNTLTAKVIHNDVPETGKFACSNELLNKIQQNITWGQRGNLHSVPTDCPQRDERLGWMGDAQIFAATASYNRDMNGFFAKWMKDISDSQHPKGYVYDVNPKIVVAGPSKPGWGDAVVVIPYVMYQFYGDKRLVEEHYESMKAWVNYLNNDATTRQLGLYHWGGVDQKDWFGYGDWVPVQKSPTKPIGGQYQIYSNRLLSEMAQLLGKSSDAQQFGNMAKQLTDKYNSLYWDGKNYTGGTQAAHVMPLAMQIAPSTARNEVAQRITENVKANNNHLSTGFLATGWLLPMLSQFGQHELAYTVASQKTYPSWGYMVEKGATTMWELWNSDSEKPEGMNSRNHFAYGSVGEWFYGYLAGLRPDPRGVGFKRFLVAPQPAGDLTWAETQYESPYGRISVRWDKEVSGKLKIALEIPANTLAEVRLPVAGKAKPVIKEGGKIQKPKSLTSTEALLEVGGGKYLFEVE
jgi:alpha-L-rhamnosidase